MQFPEPLPLWCLRLELMGDFFFSALSSIHIHASQGYKPFSDVFCKISCESQGHDSTGNRRSVFKTRSKYSCKVQTVGENQEGEITLV